LEHSYADNDQKSAKPSHIVTGVMGRVPVPCQDMRSRRNFLTSINTMCSAPNFNLVARLGDDVAASNSSVVTDMFSAMHRDCLAALDDADLVIVHVASPVSGMGIAPECHKGISRFLM
jgi:hypothetical protein